MKKTERKTKDIPDADWGDQVPAAIDEWARWASEMRNKTQAKPTVSIFDTFRPSTDWIDSFNKARHQTLQDIGIVGNKLIATLANGWLTVRFFEDVRIEPHAHGAILDYHMFTHHTLDSLHSLIPKHDGISSCILVFGCNNGGFTFEYLITPQASSSLAFEMFFTPLGESNA
jgi:hypothetical protein